MAMEKVDIIRTIGKTNSYLCTSTNYKSSHPELFFKTVVPKELVNSLKNTCKGVYFLVNLKTVDMQFYYYNFSRGEHGPFQHVR